MAAWKRRDGELPRGSEVTVEPEDAPADTVEPARGSFFATVAGCGPDGAYALLDANGVPVPSPASRAQLRHRVWRMTAFVTVTNEKRHDGVTTQHVLNEQLKHWADRSADAATQQEIAQRLAAAAAAAATAATTTTTAATTTTTTTTTTATIKDGLVQHLHTVQADARTETRYDNHTTNTMKVIFKLIGQSWPHL